MFVLTVTNLKLFNPMCQIVFKVHFHLPNFYCFNLIRGEMKGT